MPYMVYIIYIIVLFGGLHCVVGSWSEPIDGTGSNCPVNWDDCLSIFIGAYHVPIGLGWFAIKRKDT